MLQIFEILLILFLFQSSFYVDTASDKETLKKSLGRVSKFLKNVGQSIQNERNFIDTFTNKNSNVPTSTKEGTSEGYDSLWFDREKNKSIRNTPPPSRETKQDINRTEHLTVPNKYTSKHESTNNNNNFNFIKASSTFDNDKTEPKATSSHNRFVQEKLKDETENKIETSKQKKENKIESKYAINVPRNDKEKRNKSQELDVDIFGDMMFPPKSEFPENNEVITTSTIPEALRPDFIPDNVQGGPEPGILSTPTTTTELGDLLLDPKDFGYTTTHKSIPSYGDSIPTYIPPIYLTTARAPTKYVADFKNDMVKFGMGVFSTALMKMFHWVIYKKPEDVRRLVWGFGRLVEHYAMNEKLDDFGQPTKHAFVYSTGKAADMPADERRSRAIMLHNSLQHRWDLLSEEVNSILDHIDSLYWKDETDDLINSMEPLEEFSSDTVIPYTLLERFLRNALAPWRRLKDTFRGETLKENLNKAIKKRFYANQHHYSGPGGGIESSKEDLVSRQHKKANEKLSNGQNKFGNLTKKNKENVERRNDDNLKIINWIPNVTYRTGKNGNVKEDSDDSIDNELKGIMDAITEPSRSITTNASRNKKNEKPDRISQKSDEDTGLKMTNSKRHHKKHHNRHRHRHRNTAHRLAKIIKIMKHLRPHHKKDRHKKHHHRYSKSSKRFRASYGRRSKDKYASENSKDDSEEQPKVDNRQNKFRFETGEPTTFNIPMKQFYKFDEQVYDKRNLAFRRNIGGDEIKEKIKALKMRADTDGSDEEIRLKMNLLKAMGGDDNLNNIHRANKKGLLDDSSCSIDEETFLKSKLYEYFRNK